MTDAAFADRLPGMRALLISSALVAAFASPALATETGTPVPLLLVEIETARSPAKLAPLAADSAWTLRFAAAADELTAALRSRDAAQWGPLLGGQWLTAADRARVDGLLHDRGSPFLHALFSKGPTHRVLLGWQTPTSSTAAERAAIEAGQQAEALVCWAAGGVDGAPWPATAADADNRPDRPYACARIAYSLRGDTPTWRAFIEQRED